MNWQYRLAALAGLTLALSGCALLGRGGRGDEARDDRPQELTMHVINENFYDATIYAVDQGGTRQRLGIVSGHSEETFRFRWHTMEMSVEIRLLAVGSTQTYSLPVNEGDVLELRVQPDLHRRIPPNRG